MGQALVRRGAREPSTAEFLDAVRACADLQIQSDGDEWDALKGAVLSKEGAAAEAPALG